MLSMVNTTNPRIGVSKAGGIHDTMIREVYEAFKAAGIPDEKASVAAEAIDEESVLPHRTRYVIF